MSSNELVRRDFTMDDLEMLEKAQVFHNLFLIDQAAFTAEFPKFITPYETNFQTAIDDADAQPLDSQVAASIKVASAVLEEEMEKGRVAVQKLFMYVKSIWGKNSTYLDDFNRPDYKTAYNNQRLLKELLEQCNKMAESTKYKTELVAAGYTQTKIDELLTIMNAIDDKNEIQEDMKTARLDKTRDRVAAYNAVWAYMVEINEGSKVVFFDDPTRLYQYQLYHTSHSAPAQVTGLAYSMSAGKLTWNGVSGTNITYQVQFAPDLPEPIYSVIYEGADREVVYNPGGPDSYLFRVRALQNGIYGPWSEVLIVVR